MDLPLRTGSAEQFRVIRDFLQSAFTEAAICERLGIDEIYSFKSTHEGRARVEPNDRLDAMIQVFLDCESIEGDRLDGLLGQDVTDRMKNLDLLRQHPREGSLWYGSVALYPVEKLFIVSDRPFAVKPEIDEVVSPDYVYPAISSNTRRFLRALPKTACDDFLDMCSGAGAAALVAASQYAKHAWSLDITERCTHYAEFNARLNGIENVTVLRGDLYEPVRGRLFDRIAAHPPYVPATQQQMIFRDGGSDGEQITGAIIRDLPQFLRPGGTFYAVAQATDRAGEAFEDRVRRWMGETNSEYDVVLLETEVPRPDPLEQLVSARRRFKQILENKILFSELKVVGLFYGSIVIRRHAGEQMPVTVRAAQPANADWQLADWLLRWELNCLDPAFLRQLLAGRPKISEQLELHVTHVNQGGSLIPDRYRITLRSPFVLDRECQPWVAVMLAEFNGAVTGEQAYERLLRDEVIAADMNPEQFAGTLAFFVANGMLRVDGAPLPAESTPNGLTGAEKSLAEAAISE